MANFIQQFNAGGITYDLHDSEFIIDNRTAAGAALTGVSKAPALFDGMQISYWLNYAAGSSATMNLTLADGTKTGAIPVYYSGTTRLTTHYAAGNVLHMTYREDAVISGTARGEGWWCDANYYSDSNYDIFGTAMDVDTAIYNYSLFAITGHNGTIAKQTNTNEAGTYWKANSFTQSGGNGASKKATTKGYYPYKIFYNPNNTSYTTAGGNTSTVSSGTSNLDLRYTVNGTTSANIGATGAPFFLVGTIKSDGLFYLKGDQATKEWWTAGIPTTKNTDYVYWFVGMMSSAYQVRLSDRNWFLKWTGTGDNDHLIQFEPWFTVEHADSADSVPWSGVTGKPDTFTPASHTHGYIGNDGSVAPSVSASPASGDKILISDLTDSNKVKGGPEIGSNDGKFLRHDGTWGEEVYTLTVWDHAQDPSFDSETDTRWEWWGASAQEQCTAIVGNLLQNDPKVLLLQTRHYAEMGDALYQVNEFQNIDGAYGIGAYRLSTSNTNTSIAGYNIIALVINPSTYEIVNGAELNRPLLSPMETDPAPTEGIYGLEYSNGSFSWSLTGGGGGAEIVFDSIGDGYLYSSTTSYAEAVDLIQNNVTRLRISGTLIDMILQRSGSPDVVDLVTGSAVRTDDVMITYDTMYRITLDGDLYQDYVKGQVPLFGESDTGNGCCAVNLTYMIFGQASFGTLPHASTYIPTLPQLSDGLLSFGTTQLDYVSAGSTNQYLILPD